MTATYRPQSVALQWGVLAISGFADGSMIAVSAVGDGVKAVTGTGGETAFIETPNRQHEIAFRLMETAPVNIALMLLFEAGNVPAPVLLSSISTGAFSTAASAKLERLPPTTYDNNMPVREWKLVVPKMETVMTPAP